MRRFIPTECAAVACLAILAPYTYAGVIQTLSNPVADGAINTSGGNNDRSDWAGVTPFNADTNEGATSDWSAISVAHDSTKLYFRYQMNATTFSGFIDVNQRVFIDTDQLRASGFTGGGDQLPVGAEYMLEGASLFAFTGSSSTAWSWNWLGTMVYDDFPTFDHELAIPRSMIGSPANGVNFVAFASGSFEDYYPNNGNGGDDGDFFSYSVVPEPASLGLCGLGALLLNRRRTRA